MEKAFRGIQGQPLRNLIWQHVYACVSLVDLLGRCIPCHILDQCSICLSCISVLIWVDWKASPSPMPKLHMMTTWQLLVWRYHWNWRVLWPSASLHATKQVNRPIKQRIRNGKKQQIWTHTYTPRQGRANLENTRRTKTKQTPEKQNCLKGFFFLFAIVFPTFSTSFP